MQEGRDMGIYVYVQLINFVIKQKLTHHCKAIKDVKKKTPAFSLLQLINTLCLRDFTNIWLIKTFTHVFVTLFGSIFVK